MIGNTPLIKIKYKYDNKINEVYIKLEYYNLTGSIKDRMVKHILDDAILKKELTKGMPIIEATSGNTGISLAALGAYYNHPVHIFMPDWVSEERTKIMKMYGAKVYQVSKEDGGFKKCIELADQLAIKLNGYRSNQFNNKENIKAHYNGLGKEIIKTIPDIGGFVSGIGTGGTLIGVGLKLKEIDSNIQIICLEPKDYAIMTHKQVSGSHKIEGIGDDFLPQIVDTSLIDDNILIDDEDAVNMARLLATKLGLGVGISSGANFIASVISKNNTTKNIVTIFPDDNKKYLTTTLSEELDTNEYFISNKIELISYELI